MNSIRVMLGSVLVTIGALGTMAGPASARHGAGNGPNRPLAPRSASGFAPARAPISGSSYVVEAREEEARINEGLASGVEPWIRRLVADQLGVEVEELVPEVSLADGLAVDSLDLLELTLVIESRFAIAVSDSRIDQIRTYGDLVDTVLVSLNGRARGEVMRSHSLTARSRVVPAGAEASGSAGRADELTTHALQIIEEDAARAGRGARLELIVSRATGREGVEDE